MIVYLETLLRKELINILLDQLDRSRSIDMDAAVDECICIACRWLFRNVEGCRELDPGTPPEEIIDSIRTVCGLREDAVKRTGEGSYSVTLPRTSWTVYRYVCTGETQGKTKIRLAHNFHTLYSLPGITPSNKTADILRYVDAIVPEFRKLIEEQIPEVKRLVLVKQLYRISYEAKRKSREEETD